jgi:hypothetical protein
MALDRSVLNSTPICGMIVTEIRSMPLAIRLVIAAIQVPPQAPDYEPRGRGNDHGHTTSLWPVGADLWDQPVRLARES